MANPEGIQTAPVIINRVTQSN